MRSYDLPESLLHCRHHADCGTHQCLQYTLCNKLSTVHKSFRAETPAREQ